MSAKRHSKPSRPASGRQVEFGERIREVRKERKLTLVDVAKLTGIPVSTLSRVENGLIEMTFARVVALASGLEIPITKLIGSNSRGRHPGRRAITRREP